MHRKTAEKKCRRGNATLFLCIAFLFTQKLGIQVGTETLNKICPLCLSHTYRKKKLSLVQVEQQRMIGVLAWNRERILGFDSSIELQHLLPKWSPRRSFRQRKQLSNCRYLQFVSVSPMGAGAVLSFLRKPGKKEKEGTPSFRSRKISSGEENPDWLNSRLNTSRRSSG